MRIEEYTRKLEGMGFTVVGSDIERFEDQCDYDCTPIQMALSSRYHGDSLEKLLQSAEIQSASLQEPGCECADFMEHYAEIFRGERSGWQLSSFTVSYSRITLYYGNSQLQDIGQIRLSDVERLSLTFTTARTVMGFDPTYTVRIWQKVNNAPACTEVEENLGYMRRRIRFDPKPTNQEQNEYEETVHITEYVGM